MGTGSASSAGLAADRLAPPKKETHRGSRGIVHSLCPVAVRCPAAQLLWTTEKETLFIVKNAGLFGTKAGEVYQASLEARMQLYAAFACGDMLRCPCVQATLLDNAAGISSHSAPLAAYVLYAFHTYSILTDCTRAALQPTTFRTATTT